MINDRVPNGWVFVQADFSLVNSEKFHGKGRVMFQRDSKGTAWWNSLDELDKEEIDLYACGCGWTLEEAFDDAAGYARIVDEHTLDILRGV